MTTTSPEALRQAIERLELITAKAAHLIRWTESDAHDLAVVLSAPQEAREALGPFSEAFLTLSSRWQDHEEDWQHALHRPINVGQLRRAAEVYRALSPGGADE